MSFWDSVVVDCLFEQCLEAVNVSFKLYVPILFAVETTTILDLDESTDLIVYHQRGLYHTTFPNPCGVKAHGPSRSLHYILLLFDDLKSYSAGRSKIVLLHYWLSYVCIIYILHILTLPKCFDDF